LRPGSESGAVREDLFCLQTLSRKVSTKGKKAMAILDSYPAWVPTVLAIAFIASLTARTSAVAAADWIVGPLSYPDLVGGQFPPADAGDTADSSGSQGIRRD
jgi:hypothetical protein